MTAHLALFFDIVAWVVFVFATLTVFLILHTQVEVTRVSPHAPVPPKRAAALVRAVVLAFVAAAWLCAGRCA